MSDEIIRQTAERKRVWKSQQPRPWNDYPLGTKAHSTEGGYWTRVKNGWKWCTGDVFPTPGGSASRIELPEGTC